MRESAEDQIRTSTIPQRDTLLRMMAFDPIVYTERYEDLSSFNGEEALEHFAVHGWREGRSPSFKLTVRDLQARLRLLKLETETKHSLERMIILSIVNSINPAAFAWPALSDLLHPSDAYSPILIVGDSHSRFFDPAEFLGHDLLPVQLLCSAGSARGLANPNSKSGYGPRILAVLNKLQDEYKNIPILFKFGQVDVEFVYNFKRIALGQIKFDINHARSYLEETAIVYFRFISECRSLCKNPIIVSSIFPPSLIDSALPEGYVNAHITYLNSDADIASLTESLRGLELPDFSTRTSLHSYFNSLLEDGCRTLGMEYSSEFEAMLGPDGLVAHEYIADHAGTDHHLCFHAAATKQRMHDVAKWVRKFAT